MGSSCKDSHDEAAATAPEGATEATQSTSTSGHQEAFAAARVRRIVLEETGKKHISNEACQALARAAELFLTTMTRQAAAAMREEKRMTLMYRDVAGVVASDDRYLMLQGVVPEKVLAESVMGVAASTAAQ